MRLKRKYKVLLITLIIITIILIILNILKVRYNNKLVVECGDKVPSIKDITKNKRAGHLTWNNIEEARVYKSGNYEGSFKIGKKEYKVFMKVVDTTPPIIKEANDIEISVDDDIDLLKNIIVEDNTKEKITPKIEGKYDISKSGEYKLSVIAKDKSGNSSKKDFILTVTENVDPNKKVSKSSKGYKIETVNGITTVEGIQIVNKSYPLPEDYVPENLVNVSDSAKVIDYVKEAFDELKAACKEAGFSIAPSTSYRSYNFQNILYTNYVVRDGKEAADTYSARPGYSEHQTGLAIDLAPVNNSFIETDAGKWVNDNAYKYGFAIRFPKGKDEYTGYEYESWHIRYVGKDLAKKLYNDGNWLSLEEYFGLESKYE